ncbi:MAG: hypothetical protein J6T60_08580 [Bacteroidales bacterium]|nr:hypothetical protein [Bacteroidales bacterium]
MVITLYNRKFTVFLAAASPDMDDTREELKYVLDNASIEIIDGNDFKAESVEAAVLASDCSVHVLGKTDIYTPGGDGYDTMAGVQFRTAKSKCNKEFKMFVWNPVSTINSTNSYINSIRRDVVENTFYTDKPSPIIFVEDIRNIMNVKESQSQQHEPTDIFFLYNDLDSDTANGIYNMLKDFQKVNKLGISMSSDVDYNSYISDQLADSQIGVVYYNYAGDWAVPFARQIWKDTGGNSSKTPLLVTANSEHAKEDDMKAFKGIMECTVDEQLRIPLDIKVFLDKKNQK